MRLGDVIPANPPNTTIILRCVFTILTIYITVEAQKDYHRIRGNLLQPDLTTRPMDGGGGGGGFGYTPVYTEPPIRTKPPVPIPRPTPGSQIKPTYEDPNRWGTTPERGIATFPPTPMQPTEPPKYPSNPWSQTRRPGGGGRGGNRGGQGGGRGRGGGRDNSYDYGGRGYGGYKTTTTTSTTTTTTTTTLPPSKCFLIVEYIVSNYNHRYLIQVTVIILLALLWSAISISDGLGDPQNRFFLF